MKFLALDTVFEQCAVALLSETGEVLHAEVQLGKRQQTQQILPMIEAALTHTQTPWSDIAALIFNRGRVRLAAFASIPLWYRRCLWLMTSPVWGYLACRHWHNQGLSCLMRHESMR